MNNKVNWEEEYLNEEGKMENGSIEKENIFFERISKQIREVVSHFKEDNNNIARRANHAKILAGFMNAEFKVLPSIPKDIAVGFFIPGKTYCAIVRFSNATGEITDNDAKPDLRGVGLKIMTESGEHDFLMTNAELHHAKDAREAMIAIRAGVEKDIIADKIPDNIPLEDQIAGFLGALPFLVKHLGLKTGWHIASTLKTQMKLKVESLSTETFWSRSPLAIGTVINSDEAVAVKYRLRPAAEKTSQDEIKNGESNLSKKLEDELVDREVKFYFEIQRFKDATTTPIEDASVSWGGDESFVPIAELVIPEKSMNEKESVDAVAFNPWNIDGTHFKPLGSMNRSRKKVYAASLEERTKK